MNVRGAEVWWRFDEFVVLSSPQQNFISSPPLPVGTTYELRGKSFKVAWPEPLLENSTYVFQWGNTIRDCTKGMSSRGCSGYSRREINSIRAKSKAASSIHGPVKGVKDVAVCLYPTRSHWQGTPSSDLICLRRPTMPPEPTTAGTTPFRSAHRYGLCHPGLCRCRREQQTQPGEIDPIGFWTDTWRPWEQPLERKTGGPWTTCLPFYSWTKKPSRTVYSPGNLGERIAPGR